MVGGVTSQLFLAAKGVNLGKPAMDYLAKKELTQFIPGIKALLEQYPRKNQSARGRCIQRLWRPHGNHHCRVTD